MNTLFNNNESGDARVILEENSRGELFLTTNAEYQEKVTAGQFLGWDIQSDERATQKWIGELTEQFGGRRDLALRFARKAGAIGVPKQ